MNDEFTDFVTQLAIENAITYNGKANPKALIGKIMPKYPQMKQDMKTYMQHINEIVEEVNALDIKRQKELLQELNPNFHQEKEQKSKEQSERKNQLPQIPQELAGQPLITRFPPAPSGNLHLGHLFGIVYNYEYAKQTNGKFILRIEDTNPENSSLENYEALIRDVKWITDDNISQIYYQSDRVELYYTYLKQLIDTNHAYICTCNPDDFKQLIDNSKACPCRELGVKTQQQRYEKLMSTTKELQFKEGEIVVRFKSDITHKNPAMRDFSIARIKEGEHPRVGNKYRVWPMYNLCVSIDDSLMGINYIVRGKDLEIGGERQDLIKDALGLRKSPYFHYGKMKFEDIELSKSKLTQKIEDGEFEGWDDPRMPTLIAFKKRGYTSQGFRKCLVSMGMSKRDSKITKKEYMKSLDFFNKEVIDPTSKRVSCVFEPIMCTITNIEDIDDTIISMASHPSEKTFNPREFKIHSHILIEKKDVVKLQIGDIFRLMHFANVKVTSIQEDNIEVIYLSKEYSKELHLNGNIQFVFANQRENITMITSENETLIGQCETLNTILVDDVIQFERFGFARYDRDENNTKVFYFTQQ